MAMVQSSSSRRVIFINVVCIYALSHVQAFLHPFWSSYSSIPSKSLSSSTNPIPKSSTWINLFTTRPHQAVALPVAASVEEEEERGERGGKEGGKEEGRQEKRSSNAVMESKDNLFEALQSHPRRKEAFERLWNSDIEFTPLEYQELLKACFRLGYVNPFKDLVDEVVRLNIPVDLDTWTACIYIAASREFFRLGIACLEKMVETGTIPDSKSFNQIMTCCERKGRADEAMYLFNFMGANRIDPPPLTYWSLASVLSCEERWEDFKSVEENLRARDFPESIKERFYSTAVVTRSGVKDWQGALDMLRRMHEAGAIPSIRGFTTALSTCMASGAYKELRAFVEEVRSWGIFEFDVATYNVVINSYASEKNVEGAAKWFDKIYEAGLSPSLISYSTMFKVCASTRRGDLAKEYLRRLMEEKELRPNLITLTHAIQALAVSRNHVDDAKQLLESIESRWSIQPNATAYNFVLRAAGDKSDATMVMDLYHRMKKVDRLDPEPRTIWEATIACTKARGNWAFAELAEDLMAISAQVESPRSLLFAYNALLTALEKTGEGEFALRLYAHMQAQGIQGDVITVTRLFDTLNKARMSERTVKIWNELENRRPDVRGNVNITNSVLNAMSTIDPLGAVEFFQQLRTRDQVDERSYSFAFGAYDNLGDVAGVQRLWDEMREGGLAFDRVSYGSLLRALANAGEVENAMDGLRRSEEVGVPLNNYTIALALIGCKRLRRWGTALSMIRELRDERGLTLNVVCYNSVLTVCHTAGQWRACLKLLEEMTQHDVPPDYTSLRVTMNALISAGRNAEVVRLYRQHEKGVLRKLDMFAFRLIANAFIRADPIGGVAMIKEQAKRQSSVDSRLFKALITSLGHKHEWSLALDVLSSLPPKDRDISTVCATVSALLRSEQYAGARDLLVKAEADGLTFDNVANSLGLQSSYMAEDIERAQHFLDRLSQVQGHGNSSVNFGASVLAKIGKWIELDRLLDDVRSIQSKNGKRFIVSRLTMDTVTNCGSTCPDPALLERVTSRLAEWKEMEFVRPAVLIPTAVGIKQTPASLSVRGGKKEAGGEDGGIIPPMPWEEDEAGIGGISNGLAEGDEEGGRSIEEEEAAATAAGVGVGSIEGQDGILDPIPSPALLK